MSDEEVPQIPIRALSHTKKSAEYLARKKSMSRISPKSSISRISKSSMSTARSSVNMFSPNPDVTDHHPFGNELAQVSEVAEEYGLGQIVDPEEQELVSKGLFKFCAEDYMSELQGLFISSFGDMPQMATVWI